MAYGDYIGTVVADFPNLLFDINEVARDFEINTEGLTIIGFRLSSGENHPKRPNNKSPEIMINLLAVRNITWEGKFNTIGEYFQQQREIQVVNLERGINLNYFHAKYLKRFEGDFVWKNLQDHNLIIESESEGGTGAVLANVQTL